MKVGDIRVAEPNIHAAAKYMDQLMGRYFPDAKFDDANRSLFAFAAYNAGPGRIASLRRRSGQARPQSRQVVQQRGAGHCREGRHRNTTYVRNIFKYYIRVQADARGARGAAQGARAARARKELTHEKGHCLAAMP
jgi:membrane-bound lytic murein transglycosylase MltF